MKTLQIYQRDTGWTYRRGVESGSIDYLSDLLYVLRLGGPVAVYPEGASQARGMDELPTFGGPDVVSTAMVWSWDETRVLVGTCPDDYEIIPRAGVPS